MSCTLRRDYSVRVECDDPDEIRPDGGCKKGDVHYVQNCERHMLELGHESLATTQDYLADVRREDAAKKAVADADFVPKPRLVSGTDGD